MSASHFKLIPKHGMWLVELGGDLLGPYPYNQAWTTATVLAEAAWELGHDSLVVMEDNKGDLRTLWRHPTVRHELYA